MTPAYYVSHGSDRRRSISFDPSNILAIFSHHDCILFINGTHVLIASFPAVMGDHCKVTTTMLITDSCRVLVLQVGYQVHVVPEPQQHEFFNLASSIGSRNSAIEEPSVLEEPGRRAHLGQLICETAGRMIDHFNVHFSTIPCIIMAFEESIILPCRCIRPSSCKIFPLQIGCRRAWWWWPATARAASWSSSGALLPTI